MKKIISVLIIVMMFFGTGSVFADEKTSKGMEKVLMKVKEKITADASLEHFASSTTTDNNKTQYHFRWYNEDDGKSMSVSADSEGRIISYNDYTNEQSDKLISRFSRKEIVAFAKAFIDRALPETLSDSTDILVYDDTTYNARMGLRYSFSFNRMKNGIKVKDNKADVTVCAADDKLFVRSMNVNYDYETLFAADMGEIENPEFSYMKEFPLELAYTNYYDYSEKSPVATVLLSYRIKDNDIGYIDAATGKIITEDKINNEVFKESAAEDSAAGGGTNGAFSPAEIEELNKIEGLISTEEIENKLKKLPYIEFKDMLLESCDLTQSYTGEYVYGAYYTSKNKENYHSLSVRVNAKNGKILSLYQSINGVDAVVSEKEKENAKKKAEDFLKAAAPEEFSQTLLKYENVSCSRVDLNYVRRVNNIEYVDNGINITFDAAKNLLRSFTLDFTDGEFTSPDRAINADDAYANVFKKYPVTLFYIKSDGQYKKAFTLSSHSVLMDAQSGEIINAQEEEESFLYNDISGHWCEDAATKLADIQIGFKGGKLKPDEDITQAELLRFFAGGILSKYYLNNTDEELYQMLIAEKIVTEEEKNPSSIVTREDAFVYMIRCAKLEEVAKLKDIYKVSYKDGNMLSAEKIGYAAILTGFKVICGDGGWLLPKDNLSYAEAAVMLYKFLSK